MWAGSGTFTGSTGSATGVPQVASSGSSPAQRPSSASGPSPSSGGPALTLTEASSRDSASSVVAASSLRLGRRAYSHRPGAACSLSTRSPSSFSSGSVTTLGVP